MAQRNSDGTVTLKSRGALAATPTAGSGIARSASKQGGGSGSSGRLSAPKGQTTSPKSAYR